MSTYKTVQGDTWDMIAYQQLGGTKYTDLLIRANLEQLGTLVFPAGVVLELPEIEEETSDNLPPWKR